MPYHLHKKVQSNALSGPIPSELGRLANLQEMWLAGNLLTGQIPPELGDLKRATVLNLGENQLSVRFNPVRAGASRQAALLTSVPQQFDW